MKCPYCGSEESVPFANIDDQVEHLCLECWCTFNVPAEPAEEVTQ